MEFQTPDNLTEKDTNDLEQCGKVLADAFQDYPLFYEFIGKKKYTIENARRVLVTVITSSGENTHTYLHKSGKGVCTFAEPGVSSTDVIRIIKSLKWSLSYILRHPSTLINLVGFDSYCANIRKNAGYSDVWYLFVLGVEKAFQRQGIATDMLTPFFDYFDETSQICYLETCSENDMRFYEKLGFELVKKDSYGKWKIPIIAMVRKPKSK